MFIIYVQIVGTVIYKTSHHDQTGIFYERLSLQKSYHTSIFASFIGQLKIQNSRKLTTLVPSLRYHFITKQVFLPPTLMIVAADTKKGVMSDAYKRELRKLGLAPGFCTYLEIIYVYKFSNFYITQVLMIYEHL